MKQLKKLMIAAIASGVLTLTGCAGDNTSSSDDSDQKIDPYSHKDPRLGWTRVWEDSHYWKRCDGTTLVYTAYPRNGANVDAVLNSPECNK